jgi:hypothetical protein
MVFLSQLEMWILPLTFEMVRWALRFGEYVRSNREGRSAKHLAPAAAELAMLVATRQSVRITGAQIGVVSLVLLL